MSWSPQRSQFWEVQRNLHDPLVLDTGKHCQVSTSTSATTLGAAIAGGDSRMASPLLHAQARGLGAVDATLRSLSEDQHRMAWFAWSRNSRGTSPTPDLPSPHAVAELSCRRRDAIKAAFRRLDPAMRGWVSMQDALAGLQRLGNLTAGEQSQVMHGLCSAQGVQTHGKITFSAFAAYYQAFGSSIERDRDFEELMRHHWGFAEVSDILDDMKNKFAMVGLAYAFRDTLTYGGNPQLSPQMFQDAISRVGIEYTGNEVQRLFDAFDCGHTLEILRFIQHVTSAPRPNTPIAALNGSYNFLEVGPAPAEFGGPGKPSTPLVAKPYTPPMGERMRLPQGMSGSSPNLRMNGMQAAPQAPPDRLPQQQQPQAPTAAAAAAAATVSQWSEAQLKAYREELPTAPPEQKERSASSVFAAKAARQAGGGRYASQKKPQASPYPSAYPSYQDEDSMPAAPQASSTWGKPSASQGGNYPSYNDDPPMAPSYNSQQASSPVRPPGASRPQQWGGCNDDEPPCAPSAKPQASSSASGIHPSYYEPLPEAPPESPPTQASASTRPPGRPAKPTAAAAYGDDMPPMAPTAGGSAAQGAYFKPVASDVHPSYYEPLPVAPPEASAATKVSSCSSTSNAKPYRNDSSDMPPSAPAETYSPPSAGEASLPSTPPRPPAGSTGAAGGNLGALLPKKEGAGRRRAITVGINYPGTSAELKGCINDSDCFITMLTEEFGFDVADIRQLRDDHPQRMPTRKNIIAAMKWLATGAAPGDHLFFHYSGHGTQAEDEDGDEMDGKDEALVPSDYEKSGTISDDVMRQILVQDLPKGCRLTCILDCCHSGTAMDLPYKVSLLEENDNAIDVQKKPTHKQARPAAADIVLLSGCMDDQTSADVSAGLAGNTKAMGAMTTAFKATIMKKPTASYHELLANMRKFLRTNGFTQIPQMSTEHFVKMSDTFLPEARPPKVAQEAPSREPIKKGLTIGINYFDMPADGGQLKGCINDSDTIIEIMKDTFGFQDNEICRLRDDTPNAMPTRDNIMKSLKWLTTDLVAGDELFLHFSGHGSQTKDMSGEEADGQDDTLVPCDFKEAGIITDDELYENLVEQLPCGVRMWAIMDCCHSGTILDLPYMVEVGTDGKGLRLVKGKVRRGAQVDAQADVIMISGCKDEQTSADVQGGSLGLCKASGAMTAAFRQCVTPTITCEDLIYKMREWLKKNKFTQVPQMSSEQFIQLDVPFVRYVAKDFADRKRQAGRQRDIAGPGPKPATPMSPMMMQTAPPDQQPPPRYPNVASGGMPTSPMPGMMPTSPMTPMMMQGMAPMGPVHSPQLGHQAYHMHPYGQADGMPKMPNYMQVGGHMDDYTRISMLEAQVAELRASVSPMRGQSPMRGPQMQMPHMGMAYSPMGPAY